jgi:hypothetical protein
MDRSGETREELLGIARAHGYEVSAPQLARWHRAGLLPRPKQRSLGKGHGTQTVYPAGTGNQLLRLCEIHFGDKEKRLLYVGWRLWWEGYDVSSELIGAFLDRVAVSLDKQLSALVDPATGGLSEAGWELVEASREARLDKPVRRMRRRVGRDRMPTLMSIMLEVHAGLYEAYQVGAVEGAAEDDSDAQIVEKAFRLDQGCTGRHLDDRERLGKDLETTLEGESRLFREHSLIEVVAAATDEDFSKSRDQVRLVVASMLLISLLAEQEPEPEALAMREMDKDFLREMGPPDQALMVMLWTMWHLWGPPGTREMLDSHHEQLQQAIGQLRRLGWDMAIGGE